MKLHPEDPRLTAYLLGELPTSESEAIAHAVDEDPALRVALEELEQVQRLLATRLVPCSATLLPGQRETILNAARSADAAASITPIKSRRQIGRSWLVPISAAALITLAISVFIAKPWLRQPQIATNQPAPESRPNAIPPPPGTDDRVKPSESSGTGSPPPNSIESAPRSRSAVVAADSPTLELPMQSGTSSLGWIRDSIRNDHRRPPHDAVRLEEILNSFPLRPTGQTAIARQPANGWHPDNRNEGITTHAATIATETLSCPWKPSASLVLISFRGNPLASTEIKAIYHSNTASVRSYRLLGFAAADESDKAPLPSRLSAKSTTSLVIEVETSTTSGDLGSIEWSVNGQAAAPVTLARVTEAEPSDDARFAALVCTFAQWLAGESTSLIDKDLLAALARENASESLSPDRADLVNLIQQALEL
jgi:hypothetical protein